MQSLSKGQSHQIVFHHIGTEVGPTKLCKHKITVGGRGDPSGRPQNGNIYLRFLCAVSQCRRAVLAVSVYATLCVFVVKKYSDAIALSLYKALPGSDLAIVTLALIGCIYTVDTYQ